MFGLVLLQKVCYRLDDVEQIHTECNRVPIYC